MPTPAETGAKPGQADSTPVSVDPQQPEPGILSDSDTPIDEADEALRTAIRELTPTSVRSAERRSTENAQTAITQIVRLSFECVDDCEPLYDTIERKNELITEASGKGVRADTPAMIRVQNQINAIKDEQIYPKEEESTQTVTVVAESAGFNSAATIAKESRKMIRNQRTAHAKSIELEAEVNNRINKLTPRGQPMTIADAQDCIRRLQETARLLVGAEQIDGINPRVYRLLIQTIIREHNPERADILGSLQRISASISKIMEGSFDPNKPFNIHRARLIAAASHSLTPIVHPELFSGQKDAQTRNQAIEKTVRIKAPIEDQYEIIREQTFVALKKKLNFPEIETSDETGMNSEEVLRKLIEQHARQTIPQVNLDLPEAMILSDIADLYGFTIKSEKSTGRSKSEKPEIDAGSDRPEISAVRANLNAVITQAISARLTEIKTEFDQEDRQSEGLQDPLIKTMINERLIEWIEMENGKRKLTPTKYITDDTQRQQIETLTEKIYKSYKQRREKERNVRETKLRNLQIEVERITAESDSHDVYLHPLTGGGYLIFARETGKKSAIIARVIGFDPGKNPELTGLTIQPSITSWIFGTVEQPLRSAPQILQEALLPRTRSWQEFDTELQKQIRLAIRSQKQQSLGQTRRPDSRPGRGQGHQPATGKSAERPQRQPAAREVEKNTTASSISPQEGYLKPIIEELSSDPEFSGPPLVSKVIRGQNRHKGSWIAFICQGVGEEIEIPATKKTGESVVIPGYARYKIIKSVRLIRSGAGFTATKYAGDIIGHPDFDGSAEILSMLVEGAEIDATRLSNKQAQLLGLIALKEYFLEDIESEETGQSPQTSSDAIAETAEPAGDREVDKSEAPPKPKKTRRKNPE